MFLIFAWNRAANAMQFVFEADAGINILADNKKNVIRQKGLEKIGSTAAISYDIKVGLQFLENYAVFIAHGYSKRPDYYYPINPNAGNTSFQQSQKNYSLGIDATYYFFSYFSRFNIALSLGNRAVLKAVRNSSLRYGANLDEPTIFYNPTSTITYHYMLAPEIKFIYRIVENAAIYFAFQYNLVMPNFEHYPIFLLGVDIHFGTKKTETSRKEINASDYNNF